MKRREFVGGVAAAAGLAGCAKPETGCDGETVSSGDSFEWSCVTSWPPRFPGLGMGVENFADRVREMSNGRLNIKVYGGGELVLYVVHGVLHLCGFDDHDPADRARMRDAEARVLEHLGFERDVLEHEFGTE